MIRRPSLGSIVALAIWVSLGTWLLYFVLGAAVAAVFLVLTAGMALALPVLSSRYPLACHYAVIAAWLFAAAVFVSSWGLTGYVGWGTTMAEWTVFAGIIQLAVTLNGPDAFGRAPQPWPNPRLWLALLVLGIGSQFLLTMWGELLPPWTEWPLVIFLWAYMFAQLYLVASATWAVLRYHRQAPREQPAA